MKQRTLISLPKDSLTFFEKRLYKDGVDLVAGIDEVGRGCIAGPVVASSVILPKNCDIPKLNDSKQLTKKQRDYFYNLITDIAVDWSIAFVDSLEIDRINILRASLKAMLQAVSQHKIKPQFLLIDGLQKIDSELPQLALKKGDSRSLSIAAASVMAKVTRDKWMDNLDDLYPGFTFSTHKGYCTKAHIRELAKYGVTPIHRKTFRPVALKCT